MDINRIINIASNAGRIILENGGETYRAEETIARICNAYNVKGAEIFTIPSLIMISATSDYGQNFSVIKQVKATRIDLEKISRINDLSRSITRLGYSLENIENQLKDIEAIKPYKLRYTLIFGSLAAGCFTVVFGGNLRDALVAAFAGCFIKFVSHYLDQAKANEFFVNIFVGFAGTLICHICYNLNLASNLKLATIGSLTLLVPGLAITNAVRDTISGDLISGMMRAMEASLIAISVAIGSGVVFKLWSSIFGGAII
ncbi:MAG: hypothetical protein H6Q58_1879 [Firmicutes bacterium]|nr:hypothetical protein [Bacillota bacterium]